MNSARIIAFIFVLVSTIDAYAFWSPIVYKNIIRNRDETEVAQHSTFPYQVSFRRHYNNIKTWCVGSLISKKHILTSATCTKGVTAMDVFLGAGNQDAVEKGDRLTIYLDQSRLRVFIHEKYNPVTSVNNIAVIELPMDIKFNVFIQPINIPNLDQLFSSSKGTVVMRNFISEGNYGPTDSESYVPSKIIGNEYCSRHFSAAVDVGPSNICVYTSFGSSTSCREDGGSPLILYRGSQPFLAGIYSYSFLYKRCAPRPAVYTDVAYYLNWIKNVTQIESLGVIFK